MKKSSSYIFFDNPYFEEKKSKIENNSDKNKIVIDTDCPLERLKNAFNLREEDAYDLGVFNYLYPTSIKDCDVNIRIIEFKDSTYIDVEVSDTSLIRIIDCLEYFQDQLITSNNDNKYVIIISYDYLSEYYCNKIYPKLNQLERNLRKLLFNTYTLHFGLRYYEPTINETIQSKSKGTIRASGGKKNKEIQYIQEFFYSVDYHQIQEILFTKQWTEEDNKRKKEFLESHPDLTELSDENLRKAFSNFEPQTDWERMFANKVDSQINFDKLLNDIRNDRNKVAHCKIFKKEDYLKCLANIKQLNSAIISAITITETNDFSSKSREALLQVMDSLIIRMQEIAKEIPVIMANYIQNLTDSINHSTAQFGEKLAEMSYISMIGNQVEDIDEDTE